MYIWYIVAALAGLTIASLVLRIFGIWEDGWVAAIIIGVLCLFVAAVPVTMIVEYNAHLSKIEQIKLHVAEYSSEPYPWAIYTENRWLNQTKLEKKSYGEWSVYPMSIFDVTEIK